MCKTGRKMKRVFLILFAFILVVYKSQTKGIIRIGYKHNFVVASVSNHSFTAVIEDAHLTLSDVTHCPRLG